MFLSSKASKALLCMLLPGKHGPQVASQNDIVQEPFFGAGWRSRSIVPASAILNDIGKIQKSS